MAAIGSTTEDNEASVGFRQFLIAVCLIPLILEANSRPSEA